MATSQAALGCLRYDNHDDRDYVTAEEQRLTLAYENLEKFPEGLAENFGSFVCCLDISHNKFREVGFLARFDRLSSLVLDHNAIDSLVVFPYLPTLSLLWLNHNRIDTLYPFMQHLRDSFPYLRHLSLMGNKATPTCTGEAAFYHCLQYRLFVTSWFPRLEHLDDTPVTLDQRAEAMRLYRRPLLERLSRLDSPFTVVRFTVASFKQLMCLFRSDSATAVGHPGPI